MATRPSKPSTHPSKRLESVTPGLETPLWSVDNSAWYDSDMAAATTIASEIRRALQGRSDVRIAVLFGSEARGTANDDSDVDIAVEAPDVHLLDLRAHLVESLDREVDLLDLRDASIPMLERIVREGVVVHEAFVGAGALWRSRALAMLETDRPWYARMRDAWIIQVRDHGVSRG